MRFLFTLIIGAALGVYAYIHVSHALREGETNMSAHSGASADTGKTSPSTSDPRLGMAAPASAAPEMGSLSQLSGDPQKEIMSAVTRIRDSINGMAPAGSGAIASSYHGAIYYSPGTDLATVDSEEISASHCNHLDIAMYSFTDRQLAGTVRAYAQTGRPVRIYRDYEQYSDEMKRGLSLANAFTGFPNVHIKVKGSRTLMHIKAWSDGCILREGSANWSFSGETEQDNTLTLTADKASVQAFEEDFSSMWARPDNIIIQ